MKILRTPDDRFANLPDYPFVPHYVELPDAEFGQIRMHYLDEGPRDADVVLCLHGQGCWSYMFRKMIPILLAAGLRVIAPDFIGFGRSDKLPNTQDYTFQKHVDWLTIFLQGLRLREINAYLFDWGGFFGLRIAAEQPDIFQRIALSNTNLPHGDSPGRNWFIKWRAEQFALPKFPQGEMVNDGVRHKLDQATIDAFDAPYPDETYKTGPRRFPMILPITARSCVTGKRRGLGETRRVAETRAGPVLRRLQGNRHGSRATPRAYTRMRRSEPLSDRGRRFLHRRGPAGRARTPRGGVRGGLDPQFAQRV